MWMRMTSYVTCCFGIEKKMVIKDKEIYFGSATMAL
jgi:hypothetical protein